jgi:hypothetical protein
MMAKIVKGKGFKGVIRYILDQKKGTEILDSAGIRLKNMETIIQSFIFQAATNPGLTKAVGHISLNFSAQDKDRLTNGLMVRIAGEYMDRMGIRDTQYLIGRHFDKEHPHIHLVFNRVDNNGKTISDKNDRFKSEKICRELTREYGLYFAPGKEQVKEHRLKEPDKTKYEIYHCLKTIVPHCHNWDELIRALKTRDIGTAFKYKGRSDVIQGVIFDKNGYSFTGSKVDRQFSFSKIDWQLKLNLQQMISHDLQSNRIRSESQLPDNILNGLLYRLQQPERENREKKNKLPHIKRRKGLRR